MARKPTKDVVTEVLDGDTVRTERQKRPLRLEGIDAPEKGQRGAAKAREALEKLVGGKPVQITKVATGPYGRPIVRIKSAGKSVNKAMEKKLKRIVPKKKSR